MENFKLNLSKFKELQKILHDGKNLGIDLMDVINKVNSIITTLSSDEINIALIGSFSDGKTSAVAGLLGEVLDNMNIDQDESSDELTIYNYKTLGKNFKIVDTPGLFGYKEKEIEGKDVKFSDLTVRYLSEAHIIIYVCDAVNPLKNSHVDTIKYIMVDLKKLDSTIFVINKMDEAGYDLTDEDDFKRGESIKIQTMQKRLKESLSLSDDDVRKLHIVCISSDPKGKGVENWFRKMDEYHRRSHIDGLKREMGKMVSMSDVNELNANVEKASVKDIVKNVNNEIQKNLDPLVVACDNYKEIVEDEKQNQELMLKDLNYNKESMSKSLNELKNGIIHKINGASYQTIGSIIQEDLGIEGENVTMYALEHNINQILSGCTNNNGLKIQHHITQFEQSMSAKENFVKGAMKRSAKCLKNVKINATMVKSVRDVALKTVKFKPWGAIKLAQNLTKCIAGIGIAITVFAEGYEWWKNWKESEKLDKLRKELLSAVNEVFADVFSSFDSNEKYYKNYAPTYIELKDRLKEPENEVSKLKEEIEKLERFKKSFLNWSGTPEYTDYEEI